MAQMQVKDPTLPIGRHSLHQSIAKIANLFRDASSIGAAKIAGGIALGQLAMLVVGPFLSRLYSVDDFGKFGTLWAVGTVISSIACLRFEAIVLLPEPDEDAAASGIGGLIICLAITSVCVLACWWTYPFINNVPKLRTIGPYLWSVPLFVLTTGLYLMGTNWALRKGRIQLVAHSRGVQGGSTSLAQVVVGAWWRSAGGLLAGATAGYGFSGIWLCVRAAMEDVELRQPRVRSIVTAVRRHTVAALELSGATLLNNASLYIPMAALTYVYGTAVSGYFGLGLRMAAAPMALIATALGQSFLSEASMIVREDSRKLNRSFKHTFIRLLLTGVPVVLLLAAFAPSIFSLVFGRQWTEAGVYLRLLAPGLLAQFIVAPVSSVVIVLQMQRMFAIWEATRLTLLLIIFAAALHVPVQPRTTVLLIGLINAALYTWLGFALWNRLVSNESISSEQYAV